MIPRYLLGWLVATALLAGVGCAPAAPAERAAKPAEPPAPAAPASVAAAPVSPTAAPQPVPVKVGVLRSAVDGPIYIAYERGYFKEQGIGLELADFADTNEMVPLLAQGQLQVGGSSVAASLFNAIARGIPLKLVADKSHREIGEKVAAG